MADTVKVKLFRYDPSSDAEPAYVDYDVPWFQDDSAEKEPMSLLFALEWIYENVEAIAFDHNCDTGLCGRCAMMVNGVPKLACWTNVEKGETYTVEPLRGAPVIRDVVVDKRVRYDRFVNTDVAVQSKEPLSKLVDIDYGFWFNTLDRLNRCRECTCCYSVCLLFNEGASEKFVGPGAMAQIAMRYLDPNDEADRVWQAVFAGAFECTLCGECSMVCPSSIDIVGHISMLQKAATEAGFSADVAVIPPSIAASAAEITALFDKGGSKKEGAVSGSPAETIQVSCGVTGCHDVEGILGFKTDEESAKTRIDTHVANRVELTDEQKQEFVEYFTK